MLTHAPLAFSFQLCSEVGNDELANAILVELILLTNFSFS
jgi:hypothetical protein